VCKTIIPELGTNSTFLLYFSFKKDLKLICNALLYCYVKGVLEGGAELLLSSCFMSRYQRKAIKKRDQGGRVEVFYNTCISHKLIGEHYKAVSIVFILLVSKKSCNPD
jgi:hypothetical protein